MILRLEQIVTKTTIGTVILQIDKDEIISIEPKDTMRKGRSPVDAPLGYYGDGSLSHLFKIQTIIKTRDKTFTLEHFDDFQRAQCIDYIHLEMTTYVPPIMENKFYKKDSSALQRAQAVVSSASYNDQLERIPKPKPKAKPTRVRN